MNEKTPADTVIKEINNNNNNNNNSDIENDNNNIYLHKCLYHNSCLHDSAPYLTGHHSKLGLKESEENRWNTGSMNIQKNVDSNCESMIKAIHKLPAI